MKKLISIVSAIGLVLAIGAAQAQASCVSIPKVVPYNGYTIGGTLCYGQNWMSFVGQATGGGKTLDVVANGSVTGSGTQYVLSGSVTISLNGVVVKQITIHQTIGTGQLDALWAFLQKILAQLPPLP